MSDHIHDSYSHRWNEGHSSTWERLKEALKRDWEQTKSDFSSHRGHELHQGIADTVKQAMGKEDLPPPDAPTRH